MRNVYWRLSGGDVNRKAERTFIETIRHESVLPEGASVWAAVSGGADSVAMLLLLQRFSAHMKWNLSVLHIDHQMRDTSRNDAGFTRDLAKGLQIPFRCVLLEPPVGSSAEGAWSAARQQIYESVSSEREPAAFVSVGHTASDRAETLLMRLMEGAGLRGLGGMDYVGRGPVRRPLLDLTRRDIREYLSSVGQKWMDDPTNADDSILRNRVRHDIIPTLEAVFHNSEQRLARAAAGLSDWRDIVFQVVESALMTISEVSSSGTIVNRERYRALPRGLRLGVLWELSGRPRKGRLELEKTDRWLLSGACGCHSLPGGPVMTVTQGEFEINFAVEDEL